MNKVFLIDSLSNTRKTYGDLLDDLNDSKNISCICNSDDYYTIFIQIILSLIYNKAIHIIDNDLSKEESRRYLDQERIINKDYEITKRKNISISTLSNLIKNPPIDWTISLYTSGSTGSPKKVKHHFKTLLRGIKSNEKHNNDVWGFAYNPYHIAGVQVFLQALFNFNTIVRLFGLQNEKIFEEITVNSITHISCTPTFMRLLGRYRGVLPSVTSITSGGEKLDEQAIQQMKEIFPNTRFRNIYAMTEAGTLLVSNGGIFRIPDSLKNHIMIENSELKIHISMIGEISEKSIEGEWYYTGDLVRIIDTNPTSFLFINRKDSLLNIGGYNVDPIEVEEFIRRIQFVEDVIVYGKPNRLLGTIVCADIVRSSSSITEVEIRHNLAKQMQEFKIPRIINFVEQIPISRTGKTLRI